MSSTASTCGQYAIVNMKPLIRVEADGNFSYQSTQYMADPRAGGGESQLLTPSICSQYGLACGSW